MRHLGNTSKNNYTTNHKKKKLKRITIRRERRIHATRRKENILERQEHIDDRNDNVDINQTNQQEEKVQERKGRAGVEGYG